MTRARVVAPASDFFSDDLAQNVLVERQVRHQAFELAVLFAQLPQFAQLRGSQAAVLLLPNVEGRLADAELTADIGDRRATLRLPQRVSGCGSTVWKNGDLVAESDEALKQRTDWGRGVILQQVGTLAPFTDVISLGASAPLPRTFEKATCIAKRLTPSTLREEEFVDLLIKATERLREIYDAQRIGRDVTPAEIDADELETIANPTRPKHRGQGLGLSADERRAVEIQAMRVAKVWLEAQGYKVRDRSVTHSYDYDAEREGTIKIEVKGTTSDTDEEVLMTRNEVELHRRERGRTGLIIVSSIRLDRSNGNVAATGGRVRAEIGWDIDAWVLSPMAYRVSQKTTSATRSGHSSLAALPAAALPAN